MAHPIDAPFLSFLLPSFATKPPPYTQESLANVALKLSLQHTQQHSHPPPAANSPTALHNATLRHINTLFPDASIQHLRDCVAMAAGVLERCGLVPIEACVLDGLVCEMVILEADGYPKRLDRGSVKREEEFQTEEYKLAVKLRLYNEFPMHYKQTIKSILLDNNWSYLRSRTTLLSTPHPKFWSLFSFTARPPTHIPLHIKLHHQLMQDLGTISHIETEQLCVKDHDLAIESNRAEYESCGQTIACPVCIEDLAFEDFVACQSGCLICKSCLNRYVRVGVYDSGELRGKRVCCFLEREGVGKCGAGYDDSVVERVVGRDVWRVCEGLLFERIVRDVWGDKGCVSCSLCGYAEVKDILPPATVVMRGAKLCLQVLHFTERQVRVWASRTYADHVLLITALLTFEVVLACFLINPLLGVAVSAIVKLVLEVTGLWKQPMNLLFEMARMDPNVLVAMTNRPDSRPAVVVKEAYAWVKQVLTGTAGTLVTDRNKRPIPFNCGNPACGVASCGDCGKEWTACHVCHEVEKDSLRLYVEQAKSEAFIRTCPRCTTRYTKQSGCNKMTCPQCSFIMCYVCRQNIGTEGYQHFCQHFRLVPGTACSECQKCDLYMVQEDEGVLERVGLEAEREWRERHPMAAGILAKGAK
ncbi:hypothetical protein HDU98_007932 [Podochytrium sp. JEL0797]|nr:hypothetical protein HDU98_007932 [Podochytrium sp. JEL0797]